LPEDELLELFKMAHARDMTFNDFIVEIVSEKIAIMNQELADHGPEYVRKKYDTVNTGDDC
jgi:hypothetical protein